VRKKNYDKTQIVTKSITKIETKLKKEKNSNCDKTTTVKKLKDSNSDKTQMVTNSKTQIVTKLNSN
jgi:hypothetical protein